MAPLGFPRSRIQCLTKWPSLLEKHRQQQAAQHAAGDDEMEETEEDDETTGGVGAGGRTGVAALALSSGVRRVRAVVASDLRCVCGRVY